MSNLNNIIFALSFISIGALLFGYIVGINSHVVIEGQLLCTGEYTALRGTWTSWGYGQCYELSFTAIGLVSIMGIIGAMGSSLICFRYADDLGRKLEVQIAAILYITGSFVAAASPVLWGVAIGLLVYGLAIGFGMHVLPLYMSEISPANVRGSFVSATEAIMAAGMFLGFSAGYVFSHFDLWGWRLMFLGAAFLAAVMLCGVAYVPQSPRYLVLMAARSENAAEEEEFLEEALASLAFFRGGDSDEAKHELRGMRMDMQESLRCDREAESLLRGGKQKAAGALAAFAYPRPLVVGCGLVALQEVTGQPSVLYYATKVFERAGFRGSSALDSVFLGLIKLLATLFTVWHVDHYGRRLLLMVGISMMTVPLAVIQAALSQTECAIAGLSVPECPTDDLSIPQAWAIVTALGLMVYIIGYQVGFGPIVWLLISEIFPLSVRGSALSVTAMVNFGFLGITVYSSEVVMGSSMNYLFAIFLSMSLVSIGFVWVFVPETKGKTLEEIEALMRA
jgi:sugar porter (SP) family MFS transporter